MKKIIVILFLLLNFSILLVSQEVLKSSEEQYYDSLSLIGIVDNPSIGYRTLSDSVWTVDKVAEHPWILNNPGTEITLFESSSRSSNLFLSGINRSLNLKIFGPEWFNSYNNDIPYGQNDGALWQGAGYNTSISSGFRLDGYGLELTLKPVISWSQNKDFTHLEGINGYSGSYYLPIDIVQRYGESPVTEFSWGDSEIRFTWHTFTLGFGTQSPWLGPAFLNPMLGSNNAAPYPKLDIGLRKTKIMLPFFDWYAGDIEARIFVGRLKQSDYFSPVSSNSKPFISDDRMLIGGSFSFSPSFIDGFSFGLNRIFMLYWKPENLSYILRLFTDSHDNATGTGNDEDQKASLFLDWRFPDAGFEFYGEYGFDDFSYYKIPDLFHTGIYTVGLKQITPITDSIFGVINAEWNNFEMSSDFHFQFPYYSYYSHNFVRQGYTNNGQILGAGTGYSGNSQYLGYTLYYPKGSSTLSFHRYCNDNNYILNLAVFDKAHQNTGFTADEVKKIRDKYGKYETTVSFGLSTLYYVADCLSICSGADLYKVYMRMYDLKNNFWSFSANCSIKYSF